MDIALVGSVLLILSHGDFLQSVYIIDMQVTEVLIYR